MIVITGPGRSGTSFLADLYRNLGFDPGGGWDKKIRAGREQHEIVEVNSKIYSAFNAPDNPPPIENFGAQRWDLVGELADEFGPVLRDLASRFDVVKDPRFCWTLRVWLEAKAQVDHVVLSMRRLDEVQASAKLAGMAAKRTTEEANQARSDLVYRVGSLITTVADYDVAHTTLWFPDYLSDPDAVYDKLVFPAEVTREKFVKTFKKTLNPRDVHFGARP